MKKYYILLVTVVLLCTACSNTGNNLESKQSTGEVTSKTDEVTTKESTLGTLVDETIESSNTNEPGENASVGMTVSEENNTEKQLRRSYSRTDMDWIDVYIYIINTINTRRMDNDGADIPGIPVFTLLRYNDSDVPVLITGYLDSNGIDRLTVYSNEDGYLYDIGTVRGTLYKKDDEKRFCVQLANGLVDKYRYENQALIREEQINFISEGFSPVTFTTLEDNVITSENISSFIQ